MPDEPGGRREGPETPAQRGVVPLNIAQTLANLEKAIEKRAEQAIEMAGDDLSRICEEIGSLLNLAETVQTHPAVTADPAPSPAPETPVRVVDPSQARPATPVEGAPLGGAEPVEAQPETAGAGAPAEEPHA